MNEDEATQLINKVVNAGEMFEFEFENTINFEFWSNDHVRVKLNLIPLDDFLSGGNLAIRGSYETDKSQLYIGFYQR